MGIGFLGGDNVLTWIMEMVEQSVTRLKTNELYILNQWWCGLWLISQIKLLKMCMYLLLLSAKNKRQCHPTSKNIYSTYIFVSQNHSQPKNGPWRNDQCSLELLGETTNFKAGQQEYKIYLKQSKGGRWGWLGWGGEWWGINADNCNWTTIK